MAINVTFLFQIGIDNNLIVLLPYEFESEISVTGIHQAASLQKLCIFLVLCQLFTTSKLSSFRVFCCGSLGRYRKENQEAVALGVL